MPRKISQLTSASLPLPGTALFPSAIGSESFAVSLSQLRTNAVFTGTLTVPNPAASSNNQDAASTSWVRTHLSGLSFSIAQGGTGASTASGARANLQTLASKSLTPSANTTLTSTDAGSLVDVNATSGNLTITLPVSASTEFGASYIIRKSDTSANTVTIQTSASDTLLGSATYVLRETRHEIIVLNNGSGTWVVLGSYIPSLDSFKNNGLTLYHANNLSNPVALTTYTQSGVYGLSVPILKCSGGRFDFDPLDNKAEFRVTGAATQFNIYNSTNAQTYFTVNSDLSVQLYGNLTNSGRLIISNATASTSTSTGSGTFAGGLGVAGTINANALALTTALPISSGGTGANTASAARTALGLDPSTAQYNASQLRGQLISNSTATSNQMLVFRSNEWQPRSVIQWLGITQAIVSTAQNVTGVGTSWVAATGLTTSITPRSTSSRFKITVQLNGAYKASGDTWLKAEIRRGATSLGVFSGTTLFNGSTSANAAGTVSFVITDAPATTSSTTYAVFIANGAGSGTVAIQNNGETSILLVEEFEP